MSTDEAADAAIAAVKQLSADVNIPHVCEAMKADEIEVLAKDAMADACFPGNPREATLDASSSSSRRSARLPSPVWWSFARRCMVF